MQQGNKGEAWECLSILIKPQLENVYKNPPKVSSHFADGWKGLGAKPSVWVMLSSLVHEHKWNTAQSLEQSKKFHPLLTLYRLEICFWQIFWLTPLDLHNFKLCLHTWPSSLKLMCILKPHGHCARPPKLQQWFDVQLQISNLLQMCQAKYLKAISKQSLHISTNPGQDQDS